MGLKKTNRSIKRLKADIQKTKHDLLSRDKVGYKKAVIALTDLFEMLSHVESNLVAVLQCSLERNKLIDQQVEKEVFEGNLHEKYHTASQELVSSIKNLFLSVKTCLNRLPHVFVGFYIDSRQVRGIKVASFGKWLNSMEATKKENPEIYLKSIKNGRKIDNIIIKERDFIEHGTPSEDGKLLSTIQLPGGFKGAITGKYKAKIDLENDPDRKIEAGKAHWTKFINFHQPSSYCYFVHFSPYKDAIRTGSRLSKGDSIGRVYHSIASHFQKHGQHHHIFTSPNLSSSEMVERVHQYEEVERAPEPTYAVTAMCDYILETLKELKKKVLV